ncbi:MAG: class I SAM-dependent methyltransferase [Clostridia bacterium]|nr:class I SAM-dependent methyltransferase [Clostridia bacterium]
MEAYKTLADVYDLLQSDELVKKEKSFALKAVKKAPVPVGVDVGCGTGEITRALKDGGYDVTGTDVSSEMLSVAVRKSEGINYYLQSAENFSGFDGLGFITAVNDVVNYLSEKKVTAFFKRAFGCLRCGGVFAFDISSEEKLKNVLGNEMFGSDDEDLSFMWFNTLKKDRVIMDLVFFKRDDGGKYTRTEERHVQFIHGKDFIVNELKKAGFTQITVKGYPDANPLRIYFTAIKK